MPTAPPSTSVIAHAGVSHAAGRSAVAGAAVAAALSALRAGRLNIVQSHGPVPEEHPLGLPPASIRPGAIQWLRMVARGCIGGCPARTRL